MTYEKTGINSMGRSLFSQEGQWEGGEMIDSPFGSLKPTTL